MAKISLSELEINEILEKEILEIKSDIKWKSVNNQNHYRFRIPVLTENKKIKGNLSIVGTKNKESKHIHLHCFLKKNV